MTTIVCIPSIGASERFEAVVVAAKHSIAEFVWVIENQDIDEPRHQPTALARLVKAGLSACYSSEPKLGLYGVWNKAIDIAASEEIAVNPKPIAVILNDDIEIPAGSISMMIEALRNNDDLAVVGADYVTPNQDPVWGSPLYYCSGSFRTGGIGGFAFACRADRCRVDEQFEIWGGDDDLIKQALHDGWRVAVQRGAPVRHPVPETTVSLFPELGAAKDRDRERMFAKWGETWG